MLCVWQGIQPVRISQIVTWESTWKINHTVTYSPWLCSKCFSSYSDLWYHCLYCGILFSTISELKRYVCTHWWKSANIQTLQVVLHCLANTGNICLFMVALCNRADHIYFHPVSFFFFFFFFFLLFFPRLISAVGDWMSTILRHMVWS